MLSFVAVANNSWIEGCLDKGDIIYLRDFLDTKVCEQVLSDITDGSAGICENPDYDVDTEEGNLGSDSSNEEYLNCNN